MDDSRIGRVQSFEELLAIRFTDEINAVCWERTLPGDFAEVVARLGEGEGIVTLDEARLRGLPLSPAGKAAVDVMLEDQQRLRAHDLDPVLNCIYGYPRDEQPGPVPTDVFSFHVDSAPISTDTWLCTYHGPPSEGLPNVAGKRWVEIAETRAELLRLYDGKDDDGFREFLRENCYDLHYTPLPGARPYSFGVGHIWRIACEWPGSPVPPCIHRAPDTRHGQPPRLLLIS
jgi:hypothetical protein